MNTPETDLNPDDDVPPAAERALFLDDDPDVVEAAEMMLARNGFELVAAQTPEDAARLLAEQAFDIVLLDLNFQRGETSGQAGLAFLRQHMHDHPHLPVVVVTGHSGMAIAVEAMRIGAQDFVVKPWNNDRFLASIRAAIDDPRRPPPPRDVNLERSERDLIRIALERRQFNISHAAKDLGLTRGALYRRMEKHGL
ncbi:response regulator [Asticcacaulis solisilvae]|uniref:response regulator n=1 Tax=Asticcacaulis solisilvae TaxID=1217274 RepID=UPI003FD7BEAB